MRALQDLLRRPLASLLAIALLTIVLCAARERLRPTVPQIQDEFSYLLAADTYSRGRLTNPPHPLAIYLDVAHVLQKPTYQSKYQPGQGLVLALGQVTTGSALVGVWLGLALACAAVCWMLRAWLSAGWAFLGGLLAATNGTLLTDWGGSYMGGAVAMLGGALMVGALARGVRHPRARHGVLLASGLLILAMTRPFEGLIASLPTAAVLLAWTVPRLRDPSRRGEARRLILPLVLTLLLGGAWMAYYDYRVTGSPWRLPYQLYLAQHEVDIFSHPRVDELSREELDQVRDPFPKRLADLAVFHLGGRTLYGLPLLVALRALLRRRWARYALVTSAATLLAASLTYGAQPHYSAPIAALVLGLLVQSLAVIAGWTRWRAAAPLVVGIFLALWLEGSYRQVAADTAQTRGARIASQSTRPPNPPQLVPEADERRSLRTYWRWFAQIGMPVRQIHLDRLSAHGERHLVLVLYRAASPRYREWAYNSADIDSQDVVWALWRPSQPLWPLLQHFQNRQVWYIVPERDPWKLLPFPTETVGTWYLREHGDAAAELKPTPWATDPVRVEISRAGDATWHLQLERAHPPVDAGRTYTVSFEARADAPRPVRVVVGQAHSPWRPLGQQRAFAIGTQWKRCLYRFEARDAEPVPRVVFNAGASAVALEISDVSISTDSRAPENPADTILGVPTQASPGLCRGGATPPGAARAAQVVKRCRRHEARTRAWTGRWPSPWQQVWAPRWCSSLWSGSCTVGCGWCGSSPSRSGWPRSSPASGSF